MTPAEHEIILRNATEAAKSARAICDDIYNDMTWDVEDELGRELTEHDYEVMSKIFQKQLV